MFTHSISSASLENPNTGTEVAIALWMMVIIFTPTLARDAYVLAHFIHILSSKLEMFADY